MHIIPIQVEDITIYNVKEILIVDEFIRNSWIESDQVENETWGDEEPIQKRRFSIRGHAKGREGSSFR